uniref:Uncharacterized protein n=1 Tax=Leersia perrieri TaxID=77586 RepID=A0A0D9VW30_9ORYZ
MASAVVALSLKLGGKLMDMATDRVEMALGVPGEITKLETTLGDIQSILADAETHPDRRRRTGASILKSDIVGKKIEQDTKKLVDLLVNEADAASRSSNDENVVVVAITGVGGIGKTTLARMVYNDKALDRHFQKIWLSVNQDVNEIDLLQHALANFGVNYLDCAKDKTLLEGALKNAVKHKRFLLVMDDVWSDKEWNDLLREPFKSGASGSRVLVTTRDDKVAYGMKAHHIHQVNKLERFDAWSLLKKQAFGNTTDESEIIALEDIGMKIVDRCDGLPLTIKVIGGLLRQKKNTRNRWMRIYNHPAWSMDITNDLNKAICLSYEELPSQLKPCFLYCSLFPKDEPIRRADIVQMWIAEGKEEGILLSEGQSTSIPTLKTLRLRQLSVSKKEVKLGALQKQVSLRALMLHKNSMADSNDFLNNLSSLRVLNLHIVDIVELPQSICHLKHLRYLGVAGTSITTIPQDIGDLRFLQAIDLSDCTHISQIPQSILKLKKLRLEDLVTLAGFPTHSADGWCSLEELGTLQKLKILEITGLEKASSGSIAAKANLSMKSHLRELYLMCASSLGDNGEVEGNFSGEEQDRIEKVLSNLCPPEYTELLTIGGYFGVELPQWMKNISALINLTRLEIKDYACCRLPNGMGQLPFLDYFFIERAPSIQHIGHEFLVPPLLHGDSVAFPQLKTLVFKKMLKWEKWDWEEQVRAMPVLECLSISNCELKYIPLGLAWQARALKSMFLESIRHLVSIENFPLLAELQLIENPKLEKITNNPNLKNVYVWDCPRLKVLEELPSLDSIYWLDLKAETLPEYFRVPIFKSLFLHCNQRLLRLISLQDTTSEWGKIQHVSQLQAYGCTLRVDLSGCTLPIGLSRFDFLREITGLSGFVSYTKEPYSFETRTYETSEQAQREEDVARDQGQTLFFRA